MPAGRSRPSRAGAHLSMVNRIADGLDSTSTAAESHHPGGATARRAGRPRVRPVADPAGAARVPGHEPLAPLVVSRHALVVCGRRARPHDPEPDERSQDPPTRRKRAIATRTFAGSGSYSAGRSSSGGSERGQAARRSDGSASSARKVSDSSGCRRGPPSTSASSSKICCALTSRRFADHSRRSHA